MLSAPVFLPSDTTTPDESVRIVSLVPSVTECLLAWGIRPVGVTRFCGQPDITAVGGTKDPDIGAISALGPDLVVLCQEENRLEDAEAMRRAGIATHALVIDSVGDVGPELAALAARIGVDRPAATRTGAALPGRADAGRVGDGRAPDPEITVRAFIPIWRRPYRTMGGGCYGSSLLRLIGVGNVFDVGHGGVAERYPSCTLVEAASRRPDVVLAPSEPYPFGATHLDELSAVAPVILVDGKDLFWWGVRTPSAIERFRGQLAPLLGAQHPGQDRGRHPGHQPGRETGQHG